MQSDEHDLVENFADASNGVLYAIRQRIEHPNPKIIFFHNTSQQPCPFPSVIRTRQLQHNALHVLDGKSNYLMGHSLPSFGSSCFAAKLTLKGNSSLWRSIYCSRKFMVLDVGELMKSWNYNTYLRFIYRRPSGVPWNVIILLYSAPCSFTIGSVVEVAIFWMGIEKRIERSTEEHKWDICDVDDPPTKYCLLNLQTLRPFGSGGISPVKLVSCNSNEVKVVNWERSGSVPPSGLLAIVFREYEKRHEKNELHISETQHPKTMRTPK